MRRLFLSVLLAIAIIVIAVPLFADIICAPREAFLQKLHDDYEEVVWGMGLIAEDGYLEVWVNRETGSWTIMITYTDGQSCVLATGEDWEDFAPPEPAPGAEELPPEGLSPGEA